ncbi:unnamed protein product [Timema podura]|uniref:Dynein heavy chain linker domain-containing protein n=1 Tax=Timema podura TaxID=61482 RepID=A0ABN7PBT5_TIMPD|nr:unnamed protein product [Timema podura]
MASQRPIFRVRRVMRRRHPLTFQLIVVCPEKKLLESLKECNHLLEQVQKGLSDYLETKRIVFPRFYFLSDEELLEILSQGKNPTAVQPHLRKCFENIAKLHFEEDLEITAMYSGEGECVKLDPSMYPSGNVEHWLLQVTVVMDQHGHSSDLTCIAERIHLSFFYDHVSKPDACLP